MTVGQKVWFLKPEPLDNQQKTINKPHDFDRFVLVGTVTESPRSVDV